MFRTKLLNTRFVPPPLPSSFMDSKNPMNAPRRPSDGSKNQNHHKDSFIFFFEYDERV